MKIQQLPPAATINEPYCDGATDLQNTQSFIERLDGWGDGTVAVSHSHSLEGCLFQYRKAENRVVGIFYDWSGWRDDSYEGRVKGGKN